MLQKRERAGGTAYFSPTTLKVLVGQAGRVSRGKGEWRRIQDLKSD